MERHDPAESKQLWTRLRRALSRSEKSLAKKDEDDFLRAALLVWQVEAAKSQAELEELQKEAVPGDAQLLASTLDIMGIEDALSELTQAVLNDYAPAIRDTAVGMIEAFARSLLRYEGLDPNETEETATPAEPDVRYGADRVSPPHS